MGSQLVKRLQFQQIKIYTVCVSRVLHTQLSHKVVVLEKMLNSFSYVFLYQTLNQFCDPGIVQGSEQIILTLRYFCEVLSVFSLREWTGFYRLSRHCML